MTYFMSSDLVDKITVHNNNSHPLQAEGRRRLIELMPKLPNFQIMQVKKEKEKVKTLPMNDVNEIIARATLDDERDLWVSRKRKTEPFDLPDIMSLLNFKDLSFDPHEYRKKMADIVHVAADTPMYIVHISESYGPKVVFTSKLKYYVALSDNVVNQSMNEVFAQLGAISKVGGNVQERKNQTESAIRLILTRIKHFLDTFDTDKDDDWRRDKNWKNIISEHPDLEGNRNFKEMIAFYHYMAAQIFRYQLELNSRYGYNVCLNDVAVFYSEDLHRTPDTGIIDIVPAPDCTKTAAKLAKARKDFGLRINAGKDVRDAIIEELTAKLLDKELIGPEDADTVKALLSEGKCKKKIHWLGSAAVLAWFIKGIREIRMKNGIQLVTLPKGASHIWDDVIHNWFVDKDGHSFKTVTESGTTKDRLKDVHKLSPTGKLQKTTNDLIHIFEAHV